MRWRSHPCPGSCKPPIFAEPPGTSGDRAVVELEFSTIEAAQRFRHFRHFLETHIWATPANSPALVGSPRARIVEVAGIDVS